VHGKVDSGKYKLRLTVLDKKDWGGLVNKVSVLGKSEFHGAHGTEMASSEYRSRLTVLDEKVRL